MGGKTTSIPLHSISYILLDGAIWGDNDSTRTHTRTLCLSHLRLFIFHTITLHDTTTEILL